MPESVAYSALDSLLAQYSSRLYRVYVAGVRSACCAQGRQESSETISTFDSRVFLSGNCVRGTKAPLSYVRRDCLAHTAMANKTLSTRCRPGTGLTCVRYVSCPGTLSLSVSSLSEANHTRQLRKGFHHVTLYVIICTRLIVQALRSCTLDCTELSSGSSIANHTDWESKSRVCQIQQTKESRRYESKFRTAGKCLPPVPVRLPSLLLYMLRRGSGSQAIVLEEQEMEETERRSKGETWRAVLVRPSHPPLVPSVSSSDPSCSSSSTSS